MHPRLKTTRALRQAHSRLCRTLDNFIVRPQRRTVEKFAKPEAWKVLSPESRTEVAHEVAGLATELEEEPEETKRFDLLMLNLELSMLRTEPAYVRLQNQVREIAELLEEKDAIPILRVQMDLIQDIQADDWGRMRRFRCSSRARRRERDRAPAACGCYERCQVLCEGPPFPARAH
jgi:type I restriction enzyme, R subunit